MTSLATPRVLVTVPGVEDFTGVAALLQAAGAQITTGYREFEIAGPLTDRQAAAVWALANFEDGNSDGNQLDVQVDPPGRIRTALDVMCPGGWPEDLFRWPYDDAEGGNPHQWWAEQQARQKVLRAEARQAVAAPPVLPEPTEGCCGEGGVWAPAAGEPHVGGCQLCPKSATYWRRGRTTAQHASR